MKPLAVGVFVAIVLLVADLEAFGYALGGVVALCELVLVPGLGFGLVFWGWIRRRRRLLAHGTALLAAAVVVMLGSSLIRRVQTHASMARGDAICRALDRHRQVSGTYPDALGALVPAFLPRVPPSCMGLLRSQPFGYDVGSNGDYRLGFRAGFFLWCGRGSDGRWFYDD